MSGRKELATVEEKCETCRFWFADPDALCQKDKEFHISEQDGRQIIGWCRRYPPKIISSLVDRDHDGICQTYGLVDMATYYPPVWFNEWCGEYQPTPVPPADPQ